jgi:hypothetical protein
MMLYRVITIDDITTEESIGAEIKCLHRTREGAEMAKDTVDAADWDEDWGDQPDTTVTEITDYETEDDARADGYHITP